MNKNQRLAFTIFLGILGALLLVVVAIVVISAIYAPVWLTSPTVFLSLLGLAVAAGITILGVIVQLFDLWGKISETIQKNTLQAEDNANKDPITISPALRIDQLYLPAAFIPPAEGVQNIVNSLTTPISTQFRFTVVYGLPGMGKTSLAKSVCHDPKIQAFFKARIFWLSIGHHVTNERLTDGHKAAYVDNLLHVIGQTPQMQKFSHLQILLANEIRSASTPTLIILDDVASSEVLKAFVDLPPQARVLVTSRDNSITAEVAAQSFACAKLGEAAAAQLLGLAITPTDQDVLKKLIAQCDGLPLALTMVKGLLQNESPAIVLGRLQNPKSLEKIKKHLPDYPWPNLLEVMRQSIEGLAENEQACLLASCAFFEEAAIPSQPLRQLWLKNRLVADAQTAQEVLDKLANRGLLMGHNPHPAHPHDQTYQLHDLLRDFLEDYVLSTKKISPAQLHQRLLNTYAADKHPHWGEVLASEKLDTYIENHLFDHLVLAKRFQEAHGLFCDKSWVLKRAEQNLLGLLNDVQKARGLIHPPPTLAQRLRYHFFRVKPLTQYAGLSIEVGRELWERDLKSSRNLMLALLTMGDWDEKIQKAEFCLDILKRLEPEERRFFAEIGLQVGQQLDFTAEGSAQLKRLNHIIEQLWALLLHADVTATVKRQLWQLAFKSREHQLRQTLFQQLVKHLTASDIKLFIQDLLAKGEVEVPHYRRLYIFEQAQYWLATEAERESIWQEILAEARTTFYIDAEENTQGDFSRDSFKDSGIDYLTTLLNLDFPHNLRQQMRQYVWPMLSHLWWRDREIFKPLRAALPFVADEHWPKLWATVLAKAKSEDDEAAYWGQEALGEILYFLGSHPQGRTLTEPGIASVYAQATTYVKEEPPPQFGHSSTIGWSTLTAAQLTDLPSARKIEIYTTLWQKAIQTEDYYASPETGRAAAWLNKIASIIPSTMAEKIWAEALQQYAWARDEKRQQIWVTFQYLAQRLPKETITQLAHTFVDTIEENAIYDKDLKYLGLAFARLLAQIPPSALDTLWQAIFAKFWQPRPRLLLLIIENSPNLNQQYVLIIQKLRDAQRLNQVFDLLPLFPPELRPQLWLEAALFSFARPNEIALASLLNAYAAVAPALSEGQKQQIKDWNYWDLAVWQSLSHFVGVNNVQTGLAHLLTLAPKSFVAHFTPFILQKIYLELSEYLHAGPIQDRVEENLLLLLYPFLSEEDQAQVRSKEFKDIPAYVLTFWEDPDKWQFWLAIVAETTNYTRYTRAANWAQFLTSAQHLQALDMILNDVQANGLLQNWQPVMLMLIADPMEPGVALATWQKIENLQQTTQGNLSRALDYDKVKYALTKHLPTDFLRQIALKSILTAKISELTKLRIFRQGPWAYFEHMVFGTALPDAICYLSYESNGWARIFKYKVLYQIAHSKNLNYQPLDNRRWLGLVASLTLPFAIFWESPQDNYRSEYQLKSLFTRLLSWPTRLFFKYLQKIESHSAPVIPNDYPKPSELYSYTLHFFGVSAKQAQAQLKGLLNQDTLPDLLTLYPLLFRCGGWPYQNARFRSEVEQAYIDTHEWWDEALSDKALSSDKSR